MTGALTWVVGRGGLLGRAVESEVGRRDPLWMPSGRAPWGDPGAAAWLERAARQFADDAGRGPWQLAWCAGAGVTGTTPEALATENDLLRTTLSTLQASGLEGGTAFVASSAGGVYAGSPLAPPFTEHTPPAPISPYGEAKIEAEAIATSWGKASGSRVVVGRIANLYGPGQSLLKPQGLISQFCRVFLTGQPLSLYVPLDTVRDYLYVGDCGALVASALRVARTLEPGAVVTKIFASHRPVTIGALLGEMRRLFRRAPRVFLGTSPVARFQASDLRFASVSWTWLDRRPVTPLPVGINATMEDLRVALRAGRLDTRNERGRTTGRK